VQRHKPGILDNEGEHGRLLAGVQRECKKLDDYFRSLSGANLRKELFQILLEITIV